MNNWTPIHYTLRLEPDLDHFTFTGEAEIHLQGSAPSDRIILNALDLTIRTCTLVQDGTPRPCAFALVPEAEQLVVTLPTEASGSVRVRIAYSGEINNRMAGFYRSAYGSEHAPQFIGVTQFQESDARRAFPCFDHPVHKATFAIEMRIDPDQTAVSNCAVADTRMLPGGKRRVRFAQTPKMSTYLVFWGVGGFKIAPDALDPRVRTVVLPGREAFAAYGLDFGRKALAFCEAYFAVAYPLAKLDLIAVPDFAYGAMENWGAITFRENLLLHDPSTTSRADEERICEVIAHEIVHQWFGNLVTPSEWKFLWLNESFATYFGFGVVAHHYPEWDTWHQFLNTMTAPAMDRDALAETFPIEIPGGSHVVINAATAPIIYNKGGGLLRQIEGYIGSDLFRKGLRYYLEQHAYACASSRDLWEAFEKASEKPVTHGSKLDRPARVSADHRGPEGQ